MHQQRIPVQQTKQTELSRYVSRAVKTRVLNDPRLSEREGAIDDYLLLSEIIVDELTKNLDPTSEVSKFTEHASTLLSLLANDVVGQENK